MTELLRDGGGFDGSWWVRAGLTLGEGACPGIGGLGGVAWAEPPTSSRGATSALTRRSMKRVSKGWKAFGSMKVSFDAAADAACSRE
jgi:hypothetical protein